MASANCSSDDQSPLMSLNSEDIQDLPEEWHFISDTDVNGSSCRVQVKTVDEEMETDRGQCLDEDHDPRAMEGFKRLNRNKNIEIQDWAQHAMNAINPCKECEVIQSACHSKETLEFWESVDKTMDLNSMCHLKFYRDFTRKLQELFPNEPALKNTRTMNVIRRLLLQSDTTDITARVSFSNVVRLVTFFGPIQAQNNRCILVEQVHNLMEKSLQYKDRTKKEKVSWFAGEMNRNEAEERLKGQPDYTYLVRMSQTNGDVGDFALSVVKEGVVHHLAIQRKTDESMIKPCFIFDDKEFQNLPAVIEHIKFNTFTCEDGITLWCKVICPALPFNAVMSGYKKAGKRS